MSISFNYKVNNVKAYSKNGYNNIVKSFTFVIEAKKDEIVRTSFFPVEMGEPDFNDFVDYTLLTEQQLMDWAIDAIGQEQIDALKFGLESVISEYEEYIKLNPPVYDLPNPSI